MHLGRYEEALEVCDKMKEHSSRGNLPGWIPPFEYSFFYQELGRGEEARDKMVEALKLNRNLSLEVIKIGHPIKNPVRLQRELEAYRKAGMPAKAQELCHRNCNCLDTL